MARSRSSTINFSKSQPQSTSGHPAFNFLAAVLLLALGFAVGGRLDGRRDAASSSAAILEDVTLASPSHGPYARYSLARSDDLFPASDWSRALAGIRYSPKEELFVPMRYLPSMEAGFRVDLVELSLDLAKSGTFFDVGLGGKVGGAYVIRFTQSSVECLYELPDGTRVVSKEFSTQQLPNKFSLNVGADAASGVVGDLQFSCPGQGLNSGELTVFTNLKFGQVGFSLFRNDQEPVLLTRVG